MAQAVECLSSKSEALSSNPTTAKTNQNKDIKVAESPQESVK
jgi:hypothetical protein